MLNFTKLLTTLCLSVTFITQAQMTNFALFPNKVSVSTSSTTATTLGGDLNTTSPYTVGNAVFDENGNLVFAIRDENVYDDAGTLVGALPGYSNPNLSPASGDYFTPAEEIAIIPIPNTCKKYKVLYIFYSLFGVALHDVTIDASNGVVILPNPSNYTPIRESSGNAASIAVSKKMTNNTRYIYYRSYAPDEIRRYIISSTGSISYDQIIRTGVISSYNYSEMDLSPDGKYLYWAVNNTIYSLDVSGTSFAPPFTQSIAANELIYGVEIYNGKYYLATSIGLKKCDLLSTGNFGTIANVTSVTGVINSDLEEGKNGRLYGVKNGLLFSINTAEVLQTTSIAVNSTSFFEYIYKLNDQIDGEDYTNFNGTPILAMNDVKINGIDAMNSSNPNNIITAYNCNDINLTLNTLGTSAYIILIHNHTDVNGNFTPYNSTLEYSSEVIQGNVPHTQDLKTLPGTDGDYLQTHNGYFRVIEILFNACNWTSKEIFLHIPFNPSPAIVNVALNQPGGTPVPMKQTLPGQSMGIYSGSYNISQSMGDIEFHTVKIDEINPSTGAIINTVLPELTTTPTVPINNLTALPFNALNIPANANLNWNGGPGYFAGPGQFKSYRVTIGVGNVCSTSTDWSYITPNNYARMAANDYEERQAEGAYPNPFNNETTISLALQAYEVIDNFELYDSKGTRVTTEYDLSSDNSSATIALAGENLKQGMYVYHCTTNQGVISGKIMKQ